MNLSEPAGSRGAPRRRRLGIVVLVGLLLVTLFAMADLWGPLRTDIRIFDPVQVARLDTQMWRSYYDRHPIALFLELAQLMRTEFHFPPLRSYVAAFHSARAAFEFKQGHEPRDYERVLPNLTTYYGMIRRVSATPFDVPRTAQLELEWWLVHRGRPGRSQEELEHALADAASALYGVPADALGDYARERATAMTLRDAGNESGQVGDREWVDIGNHLRAAWQALARVVRPGATGDAARSPR